MTDFYADFGRQFNEAVEHGQEFNIETQVNELNGPDGFSLVAGSNSTTSLTDGNPSKRKSKSVSKYLISYSILKYFLLKGGIPL